MIVRYIMAPFQWFNVFKRKNSVQIKHQIDLGYGFRTIAVLSSVFGQLLNFPPVQIRRFSVIYFIVRAYTFTVNFFVTVFAIGAACSMFHHLSEFSKAAYFAAGFLGVTECLLRLLFLILKRNKIEKLMIQLQNLIKQSDFRLSQPAILTRISHYVVAMIVTLLTMYISALVVNYLAVSKELHTTSMVENATSKYFLKDITTELLEVCANEDISPAAMSVYMLMVYAISFMGVGKVVVSDVMFYACYWLVIEELELLARGLDGAICRSNSFQDCDELETWINFHHSVTR